VKARQQIGQPVQWHAIERIAMPSELQPEHNGCADVQQFGVGKLTVRAGNSRKLTVKVFQAKLQPCSSELSSAAVLVQSVHSDSRR
jgi:hypothetical protein